MHPKISIIILTYNSEKNIELLFDSIKNQSFENYEVIVVDNASIDKTIEIIEKKYSDFKLIKNKENYWFSKGNNIGISKANGEYVLICNDDVKLDKNYLKNLLKKIEKNKKIGAVCGKVFKLTENKNSDILDGVGLKRTFYRKFINIGENETDSAKFNEAKQIFGVSGALFLVRKKALENIKFEQEYFDEDFIAYKEDIDLSYRLRKKSWQIYYEPSAIAWHKRSVSKSSLKERGKKNRLIKALSYRNHIWLLIKNESLINFIIFGLFIFVYEFLKFIYILLFEFYIFKFFVKSLKNTKKILVKRKYS